MLTVDSSALIAAAISRDRFHRAAVDVLGSEQGPIVVPAGILGEVGYMLERIGGKRALDAFLADLASGALTVDCGDADYPAIRELVTRYNDLDLGFADASVIACAQRGSRRILTFDRRDFEVVARDIPLALLP